MGFVTVKLKRDEYTWIFQVQEVKSLGQDADDLPGFAVYDDVAADEGSIAAKFAAPIAASKHGGFGYGRGIDPFGESADQEGRNCAEGERGLRQPEGADLVRCGNDAEA